MLLRLDFAFELLDFIVEHKFEFLKFLSLLLELIDLVFLLANGDVLLLDLDRLVVDLAL